MMAIYFELWSYVLYLSLLMWILIEKAHCMTLYMFNLTQDNYKKKYQRESCFDI